MATTDPQAPVPFSEQEVIESTRQWLEGVVIGLNLCPFAKTVHVKNRIRYAVSQAGTTEELHQHLVAELLRLKETAPDVIETTLLIHPAVLTDFLDFNDFLEIADATLEALQLDGELQIASFHPDYQFADTQAGDIENCTNRSPYPVLHLLREASVEQAVATVPDTDEIYNRNIETMRRLGQAGWESLTGRAVGPDKRNKR